MSNSNINASGLLAAEENRSIAMLASNTRELDRLLSNSFRYVHATGILDSKKSYLDKLSSGALKYESLVFTNPTTTILGDVGLVSAKMQASVISNNNVRKVTSSYLAVWQYLPEGWLLEAVQATSEPVAV
jgi:Domain of unknown function (DUF4440)